MKIFMENNKEQQLNRAGNRRNKLMLLAIVVFLVAAVVAALYLFLSRNQIYVEKSVIEAPTIDLSAPAGGALQKLFVQAGDAVAADQPVAQVGNDIIKTKDAGIIVSVNDDIGKNFAPGEAAVTMIRPQDLRVDAQIEEDKGLSDVQVGQKVSFTVDAFGSKTYSGIVDSVSPIARTGDVVFNISSARQENEFDVKIRFDIAAYPELKNGMSAKAWIYKN